MNLIKILKKKFIILRPGLVYEKGSVHDQFASVTVGGIGYKRSVFGGGGKGLKSMPHGIFLFLRKFLKGGVGKTGGRGRGKGRERGGRRERGMMMDEGICEGICEGSCEGGSFFFFKEKRGIGVRLG